MQLPASAVARRFNFRATGRPSASRPQSESYFSIASQSRGKTRAVKLTRQLPRARLAAWRAPRGANLAPASRSIGHFTAGAGKFFARPANETNGRERAGASIFICCRPEPLSLGWALLLSGARDAVRVRVLIARAARNAPTRRQAKRSWARARRLLQRSAEAKEAAAASEEHNKHSASRRARERESARAKKWRPAQLPRARFVPPPSPPLRNAVAVVSRRSHSADN